MLVGEKRRIIVVLRWVMAIALSYLVIFSARDPGGWRAGLCIALLLASNLALMRLPETTFHHPAFDPILVATDTALITAALWICGSAGADFFFVFFFVVFLAALGGRLELTALGAALAAVAYLSVLPAGMAWTPAALLRVPFFFVTALSYGYLASGARDAEGRARAAEHVIALKTAFLGTVSHEMRSPLSVILGYTDMLQDGVFGPTTPGHKEAIGQIHAHAFELLSLVDRTLNASRLESGAMAVHVEEFHIEKLLEEVRLAVAPYEKTPVRLLFATDKGIPPLVTDRLKLKEILVNLVTNALKYTAEGAVVVDVRWPMEDGVLEVAVEDTGMGIAPEHRAEIFGLYTRAPEAEERCLPGVGLGLFIVRRLIDVLQGEIRVESEPGKGSTFAVRIPRRLEATPELTA